MVCDCGYNLSSFTWNRGFDVRTQVAALCSELCDLKDEDVPYSIVLTEKEENEVKLREERREGMIPCLTSPVLFTIIPRKRQ
jgi:hypothetical protein